MKILITGAAGFIGSQLAYRLWKDKQNLILIDNFSFGYEDNLMFPEHDFREDIIKMDIRNREGIKSIFMGNKIDYVYNIAGIAPLPDCQLNPQEAVDVNLTGFINILENARLYGVKKVICQIVLIKKFRLTINIIKRIFLRIKILKRFSFLYN